MASNLAMGSKLRAIRTVETILQVEDFQTHNLQSPVGTVYSYDYR